MDAVAKSSPQETMDSKICCHFCCHYWVIESPSGPTSKGICKLCGCESEFINVFDDLRSVGAWRKSEKQHVLAET